MREHKVSLVLASLSPSALLFHDLTKCRSTAKLTGTLMNVKKLVHDESVFVNRMNRSASFSKNTPPGINFTASFNRYL